MVGVIYPLSTSDVDHLIIPSNDLRLAIVSLVAILLSTTLPAYYAARRAKRTEKKVGTPAEGQDVTQMIQSTHDKVQLLTDGQHQMGQRLDVIRDDVNDLKVEQKRVREELKMVNGSAMIANTKEHAELRRAIAEDQMTRGGDDDDEWTEDQ